MLRAALLALLLAGAPASAEEAFDAAAAWSEFESSYRLFYAYIDRDDFDVERTMEAMQQAALSTQHAEAFRQVIEQGLRAWTDAHLALYPVDTRWNVFPTSADLVIHYERDRFIVQDVRRGSTAAQAGIRPGWQLESIDGERVRDLAASVLGPFVATPTKTQWAYAATLAANGRPAGERALVFRNTVGDTVPVTLPSPRDFAIELSARPLVSITRVEGVAVLEVNNSLGNNDTIQAFDEAIQQVIDEPALIVDLRYTPSGGNTEVARSILGHFTDQTRSYQVHEVPSLEREFTVPRRFIEQVKPRQPLFIGKPVVVLGGYWTGSMGEGLVIGFDGATDAHVIASDMADLLGGMITVNLNRSSAQLSMGRESLFHVDGTPRELFEAPQTLSSADTGRNGEDAGLKAALDYLQQTKARKAD